MGKSCTKSSLEFRMNLNKFTSFNCWCDFTVFPLFTVILFNPYIFMFRPMRGGEKLEHPQATLPGMQREQQRPPPHHLHPPPPHRAWEQLGHLYESHLPPQGHPVLSPPNEHSLRLHNGGYAGSSGPSPNLHLLPSRPNPLLKVRKEAKDDRSLGFCFEKETAVHCFCFTVCVSLGVLRSSTIPGVHHCWEMKCGLRCTR